MCRRMSRGKVFGWCVAVKGACGLEDGRFGAARMCVRRGMCRRMSRERRSGATWRARALVDWSRAGLGLRVRLSCGKCVARDEAGRRRRTRHDTGRRTSPARQLNPVVTDRKEIDSSDGWRRSRPVTAKHVPVAHGVLHAFKSRDAARHKTRMNRPANMSPHVAATRFRAAHDTVRSRAAAPCPHATASPTALPGVACPRSPWPAHAFVVLRNSTPRVTPRHLL
ncbi:hypothetical protein BLA13014_06730 [Burkholderia aenigmatica]|uniref:Uncharacterized protein n=1 Tax=Burkholderia aenigmatica TaxID=2015348 RepID=A0A6P2RP40_9BURK|nr:hypothetical protein BLA13014_06730 [Burkholderia aenigmatica]